MTVEFFKTKYGYEIEGVWVPRVTAIIAPQNKNFLWKGLQQAADWGTVTHETVAKILRGEEVQVDSRIAITIEAFRVWHQENPLVFSDRNTDIERLVVDRENGYAGTVDMVAQINGVRGIIDLKTSTSIWKEYSLQTAAYLNAYNKVTGGKTGCKARWILRIDQYQECKGCLAKRREKYGRARTAGGKDICNHQWTETKGEVEFKELEHYEEDLEAFFDLKERWEWNNKEWLERIPNYEKNIRQHTLL